MKNLLKQKRQEKKLTQPQLANLLGFTNYQSLQAVELGKNIPSVELALRIAKALDCRVEDIFILE